jgi:hypothetical protein
MVPCGQLELPTLESVLGLALELASGRGTTAGPPRELLSLVRTVWENAELYRAG